jgi:hypothetical protein
MDLPFRGSSRCASLRTFIGSKIEWSRNTGYRWADKPYSANNTLLRIATIRSGTIELMQNAASTASAAEYPTISIQDIAVHVHRDFAPLGTSKPFAVITLVGYAFDSESLAFDSETLCSQLAIALPNLENPVSRHELEGILQRIGRRSSSLRSLFEAQTHPA